MTLTTTSYAILGHLAMRPWTMYDLARQMRRNVHYFFPRAESQVYAEPRRLVGLGLASARTETSGRRQRTIYEITDSGRDALARWLAEPMTKGLLLEFEGLLRVFLSPFGTTADLTATLDTIRHDIGGLLELAETIRSEYLEGRAPFQRYVLTRSMIFDFLYAFAELVDGWAERSQARIVRWSEQSDEESLAEALEIIRRSSRRA